MILLFVCFSIFLVWLLYKSVYGFKVDDEYPVIASLSPQQIIKLGGSPTFVDVGMYIRDIPTFEMEKGKIIGLLGPNGAGKTTLMEILAFIMPPTSGEIFYKNKKVEFNGSGLIDLRKKVVLVQQNPILFTTTVFNNVEFPLKIRKVEKQKRGRIVDELLGLVGMENFREAKAHNLSGGETQRIAIAQALACSPEVILLDEPTASVDVENRINIERIISPIKSLISNNK